MTLDLFARPVGQVRDPLDRFFTPDALAVAIVDRLARRIPAPASILEPSAGGGAFVRACRARWPRAWLIARDIDPDAEGLALADDGAVGDFLTADLPRVDLVIGNPPFTGDTAIAHVTRARELGDTVCFILPWGPLGGVERWREHASTRPPRWAWCITPRPWPSNVRETAAFVWVDDLIGHAETRVSWMEAWR
jgi:hypothetical protein